MATPSLSTSHTLPIPAQAHPSHSGHLGRILKYCRNCEVKFEDLNAFERHSRVARFCCFCGEPYSRAVLCYMDHRARPVPSIGIAHDDNGPMIDACSRPPVRYVGDSIRRRSRSRSPDTRIRVDDVQRIRSPLPQVQGSSYQYSLEPGALHSSHRDVLDDVEYGLAPRSRRLSTIHRRRTHNEGPSNVEITEQISGVRASPPGRSDTPHTYQEPIENIHRKRAASPMDMDSCNAKRQYNPARELSYSPREFHATIAKLREELSPVPNVRSARHQRRVDYQRMNRRWREEELKKQAKDLQKKAERMPYVQAAADRYRQAIDGANKTSQVPTTPAAWEERQTTPQKTEPRLREEHLSQEAEDLQDKITRWQAKATGEKHITMVDLTLEDD